MSKQAYKRVRKALRLTVERKPLPTYSDPGCYQLYYLQSDGETMCASCVNKNIELVDQAIKDNSRCGWKTEAVDINWEDDDMICCNCNEPIPSAYGGADE